MNNSSTQSIRISSKLTILSKISLILIGIPISVIIATQTQFAWWAILISIALTYFCVWCSYKLVNAYLEPSLLVIKGLVKPSQQVPIDSIQSIKMFQSKKHTYFYFKTSEHKFLIISPIWGKEREALFELHQKYSNKI